MSGKVFVFDGASNSGKSTIIKELVPLLGDPYCYMAIDDFVSLIFLEQQRLNLPYDEFLKRVDQQTNKMYDQIRSLVVQGKKVLLDTVLSGLKGEKSIQEQMSQLKNLPITLILVHCPLPELVERIGKRNKKALQENKPEELRTMGTALQQFGYIYRAKKDNPESSLGTISRKEIESACEMAKGEWEKHTERFEEFKQWLLEQLGLQDKNDVTLTTRLTYNYIVDTSKNNPEECALKIKDYLTHGKDL